MSGQAQSGLLKQKHGITQERVLGLAQAVPIVVLRGHRQTPATTQPYVKGVCQAPAHASELDMPCRARLGPAWATLTGQLLGLSACGLQLMFAASSPFSSRKCAIA